MRKLLFILITLLPLTVLADEEFLYCMDTAADLNKKLPLMVDEVTKWKNTTCKKGNPITIQYFYYLERSITPEEMTNMPNFLRNIFTLSLGHWCKNPDQKLVLNLFDVEYAYFDINDKYLGNIEITQQDCSKIK